jgi:hypothetical protein
MIKQAGTVGYVSISGRKIAAILLILICSFALAWAATRSGKGNKSATSVKPAQPLVAHTNQAPMGGRPVSPATHNQSKAAGKAHRHHRQGALSNFKAHTIQSSRAQHSKGAGQGANQGAGQGANQGAGQGANQGAGQGANQGAGHGANPKSDATPSPTPEESPSPTSDTTLGLSATATTPAPLP